MLAEGITALTTVMEFLEGSTTLKIFLGLAVAGVAVSVAMGIFFRR